MTQQMLLWAVAAWAFLAGAVLVYLLAAWRHSGRVEAACARVVREMQLRHQQEIAAARKQSVDASRAVIKGKLAEQFAPILPDFPYLPSDAKFLGDPVDYIIFDGYSAFRAGQAGAEDIQIVLLDVKSGRARLSAGQQAIAQAIERGNIVFHTLRIDF